MSDNQLVYKLANCTFDYCRSALVRHLLTQQKSPPPPKKSAGLAIFVISQSYELANFMVYKHYKGLQLRKTLSAVSFLYPDTIKTFLILFFYCASIAYRKTSCHTLVAYSYLSSYQPVSISCIITSNCEPTNKHN